MALPLRVSLLNTLRLCIVLGLTLAATSTSSYPMHSLPRGVVHVFFMHREPLLIRSYASSNTSDGTVEQNLSNTVHTREPPIRRLYHDLMNYLDRSIESVETLDKEYKQALEHTVKDPWVHFMNRTRSPLRTYEKLNDSKTQDKVSDNGTQISAKETVIQPEQNSTGTLVKWSRRHSNKSVLDDVLSEQSLNASVHNLAQLNKTQDTLQIDSGDTFTSTVEKMIEMIDEQLENKTQAIMKRMKRVAETNETVEAVGNTGSDANKTLQLESENKTTLIPANSSTPAISGILNSTHELSNTILLPMNGLVNSRSLPNTTVESGTNSTYQINATIPEKLYNSSESTNKQNSRVFEPVNKENSDKTSPIGTSAAPVTESKEEEDENESSQQQLRNIIDPVPITMNPDEWENSQKNENQVSGGDVMTALVIPVFLVVLMGTLLYAMHNMSQFFITRTNHRQPANNNQRPPAPDGFVDIPLNTVTVTSPIEIQEEKPKPEEPTKLIEIEQLVNTEPIKTVSSGHDLPGFLPQSIDPLSKNNMVANYLSELNVPATLPTNEESSQNVPNM